MYMPLTLHVSSCCYKHAVPESTGHCALIFRALDLHMPSKPECTGRLHLPIYGHATHNSISHKQHARVHEVHEYVLQGHVFCPCSDRVKHTNLTSLAR